MLKTADVRAGFSPSDLETADSGALAAALVQLTGEPQWLEEPYRSMHVARREGQAYRGDVYASFLEAAADALRRWDGDTRLPVPSDRMLRDMMEAVVGEKLSDIAVCKARQDLGITSSIPSIDPASAVNAADLHILIVGAGMAGLDIAMKLRDTGMNFTILEKNREIGGVWFENIYPECGLDTHPFIYEWAGRPYDWSRYDVKRDEMLEYIRHCVARSGILDRIRFGHEALKATYSEKERRWLVDFRSAKGSGRISANVLITAVGALNRPKIPDLPGLETFNGKAFHTARWPKGLDLKGSRVGLVGNGSSGTQIANWLAEHADSLTVFQRSPHWVTPRPASESGPIPAGTRRVIKELPHYAGWYRFIVFHRLGDREYSTLVMDPEWHGEAANARNVEIRDTLVAYIKSEIGERTDLLNKLVPSYPPYAKRLVVDNNWYKALARPDVKLVTEDIDAATDGGIRTRDGVEHPLDVLVFATGFNSTRYFWPLEIVGRKSCSMNDAYSTEDARAYLGTTMPGFPNFFCLHGPNSGVGHGGSSTFTEECQVRYILGCIKHMAEDGIRVMECRANVADDYNRKLDSALDQMVWSHPGVTSRYRNSAGRIVMNHPWKLHQFWEYTRAPDLDDFDVE